MNWSNLTTNSDFFAVAGGDTVDIWQQPKLFPRFKQELEDVARVQLLLGESSFISKKVLDTWTDKITAVIFWFIGLSFRHFL